MKTIQILLIVFLFPVLALAQSETTDRFHDEHEGAKSLFFYRNTIRMFNMNDNPKIDELIRDIEKMKFLMISKSESGFSNDEYRTLVKEYHEERFEDLMSMRAEGSNFNVLIKERNKVTHGLVVLLDNEDEFAILDIKGAVPINRVVELVGYVQSADDFDLDWD
ncbi:MAG: DUF4252 domain-containing protein [Cyclobacteriaceae bacterium]